MKIRQLFLPAAFAALLVLFSGSSFFAPAPAAAYNSFNVDESYDDGGNPAVKEFLRNHGMKLAVGLVVGMGLLFVMFIGPADVLDAARREHARGAFRRSGVFGGHTHSTPGFGSGGFGSSYKI